MIAINKIIKCMPTLAIIMSITFSLNAQLTPVSNSKGKWGYEDASGRLAVKHKFSGAGEYKEGVALVQDGKKYGVIDCSGKYVVKPDYDMITDFNQLGLAEVMKGDKHGFIDRNGKLVIPCKYKYVGGFNTNGHVWVNEGGKLEKGTVSGGKFNIFKPDGTPLFAKSYVKVGEFVPWKKTYSKEEREKMTKVERNLLDGEDYSFWRKQLITFSPGSLLPDNVQAYYVSEKGDGYYNGVYSAQGDLIIPAGKYYFANCPENGISIVQPKKGTANFYHIASGKMLVDKNLQGSWGFKDGYCIGIEGDLYYIYDVNGQKKSAGYTKIYPQNNGVHVVRDGSDKYGMIAADGHELLPPLNYAVYPCLEGRSLVKETSSSLVGYKDNKGMWVVDPIYADGGSFFGGNAMVNSGGKWGMITMSNDTVLPFEYVNLKLKHRPDQTLIWAKNTNGNYECYDIKANKILIPALYTDAYAFGSRFDGLAMVRKSNSDASWGWIDVDGKEVVPCVFSENDAWKAGKEFEDSGRSNWTPYTTYIFTLHNNPAPVDFKTVVDETLWDY